ncbi:MAG TPA: M56 family metallopeptidase [Gemmatimonadaceae bacterium]|nr:M56 family metallopeptidase [Gemmatimonadaceae bacterium]
MADSMILLLWLAKGTVVLLLAMALTVGLRRAPAGARYVVWLASLAALLLVPALSTWLSIPVRILPAPAARIDAPAPESAAPTDEMLPTAQGTVTPRRDATSNATPRVRVGRAAVDVSVALLGAWLGVAVLLFAWLVLGALKVRRIVRNGRELSDDGWVMPMYDVADRLDLSTAPRLVLSDEVEMPFACGVLRSIIVLPTSAETWSEERRRVVLFHELAHVRRRDLVGHTIGRLTCAIYWFHPLVWSAAKRLRAESERACDDLVLACGGARASDYASHLLDIVTGVRRQGAPATALPMADKKEFEGRMLAILDPTAKRATPTTLQQVLVTIGFGALALSTAAVAPTAQRAVDRGSDIRMAAVPDVRRDTVPPAPLTSTSTAERPRRPRSAAAPIQMPAPDPVSQMAQRAPQTPQSPQSPQSGITSVTREMIMERSGQPDQAGVGPDTALLGRILRTDKDAGVRKAAAWALQGRREGAPLLLERLRVDADENVREMAAWALSGMPSDDVAAALALALSKDQSEEVRATAAWALGQMRSRANIAALDAALADDDADVRERALWALGQQSANVAPKRVVELLQDNEAQVRVMAAWVLGEIRDQATAAAVRDAFGTERDREVQEAEFRTLLMLGDRSQALIDRAMASENPEIRARAVRLIAGHDMGSWPWPWPWPQPRPQP